MKVRSKTPIVFDRNGNTAKIVVDYHKLTWNRRNNSWDIEVQDYQEKPVINPSPGFPLFTYHPIKGTDKTVSISRDKIKFLFDQLGQSIIPGETSFPDEIVRVMPHGILAITQENPIYGTTSNDWELIDETAETAV